MKISRSLRFLLIVLVFIVLGLIVTKVIISRDKWLYYQICAFKNPSSLVEIEWLNLNTRWNTKNSDSAAFSNPDYNDSHWRYERQLYLALIKKPGGYSWFRKSFIVPDHIPGDSLILQLSLWDIHAQVYLNGVKIADSCYVRNGNVCCNLPRKYLLQNKNNLLAVRSKSSNIFRNENVISYDDKVIRSVASEVNLTKNWKIMKGDNLVWKDPLFNDSSFIPIEVPGFWEKIYKNYDGIAWYRLHFSYSGASNKKMLLLLGKIDDYCEVYINGIKVGGSIPDTIVKPELTAYNALNAFQFNSSILSRNNVMAVRVLDTQIDGGIYSEPLCLLSMDDFYRFHESNKNN